MLTKLLNKAKKTNSKTWKWLLGVLIAIIVFFVAWRLKRMYNELQKLKTLQKLTADKAKDTEMEAENEKDSNMAKALREEAEKLTTRAAEYDTEIKHLESQTTTAKEAVDNAKNWKELENQARG